MSLQLQLFSLLSATLQNTCMEKNYEQISPPVGGHHLKAPLCHLLFQFAVISELLIKRKKNSTNLQLYDQAALMVCFCEKIESF